MLHGFDLVRRARERGIGVLLDAAGLVATHALHLNRVPADFTAISFYKLFGYPTGLGALIGRQESLSRLTRPWFPGGTVEYVSIAHDRHLLKKGESFEDGTPDFLGISGVIPGLEFVDRIGRDRIETVRPARASAAAQWQERLGQQFSVGRLADCLGGDAAVGAVRASFGVPTNGRDIDRAIDVLRPSRRRSRSRRPSRRAEFPRPISKRER